MPIAHSAGVTSGSIVVVTELIVLTATHAPVELVGDVSPIE